MQIHISYLTSHSGSFFDLRRCILSVIKDCNASGVMYEHLIWIDGKCEDLTVEEQIHKEFIQELEVNSSGSLKIYWSHFNSGKSSCVNRLLTLAKGSIISFLDSDDWILSGRTSHILSVFHNQNVNVLGSQYFTGPSNLQFVASSTYPLSDIDIRKNLIFFPFLLYSSISISRDFLDGCDLQFNESIRAGIDIDFYYRLMRYTEVCNSKFYSVYYTKNPSGITSTQATRQIQLKTHNLIIKKILNEGDDGRLNDQVDRISIELMKKITTDYVFDDGIEHSIESPIFLSKTILRNWDNITEYPSFIARLPYEHRVDLLSKVFSMIADG